MMQLKKTRKEECIFKTSKLTEKVKPDIERIMEFKTTTKREDERTPFEDLFKTKCGKRFGNQVEAVVNFAIRGNTLSVILPLAGSFSSVIGRGIARGDLDNLVSEKSTPEERKKLDALKILLNDLAVPSPEEAEELVYSKDDVLWFLSLVTFSLHTYLDVYTMCIIEFVERQEELNKCIEQYLKMLDPPLTDITGRQILKTAEAKRVGVFRRLVTIEDALNLTDFLDTLIECDELTGIRKACKKFNVIRGGIAHSNPRLKQEKYTFQEFEKDLDEPILAFEEISREAGLPKYFDEVMDIIKPGMEELSEIIRRTALVVRMAITYPAIFDATLNALISESVESE